MYNRRRAWKAFARLQSAAAGSERAGGGGLNLRGLPSPVVVFYCHSCL